MNQTNGLSFLFCLVLIFWYGKAFDIEEYQVRNPIKLNVLMRQFKENRNLFHKNILRLSTDGQQQQDRLGNNFPKAVPLPFFRKKDVHMTESNSMADDTDSFEDIEDPVTENQKRSIASFVQDEIAKYENIIPTLQMLMNEKGADVSSLISQYENQLRGVLDLLSGEKLEQIKNILNSIQDKRRFKPWSGKRSDFYAWRGKKSSLDSIGRIKSNSYLLEDLVEQSTNTNELNRYDETEAIKTGATAKRGGFYAWGGK